MTVGAEVVHGSSPTAIELSRSGSEVLIVGNLATASLVNPEREAAQWADAQAQRVRAAGAIEPIVILGVGSGFHISAIKKLISKDRIVIAIDSCRESIDFASARVEGVLFHHVNIELGVDAFFARSEIASWILGAYTLLRHKPTLSRSSVSIRILDSWLVGRNPQSFLAQLKLRPEIAAGLNPTAAKRVAEISLVSVRDLSKMWDITSELKVERRLFRVLEELIR